MTPGGSVIAHRRRPRITCKRGGDLGEFRQGQMVPAFDKVVFSCPVLEPTGPLHTQFGYHIIKVLYRN